MNTIALIDSNNIVQQVIVIPDDQVSRYQEYLLEIGLTGNWLLCDRQAYRGRNRNGKEGPAFRKNFPLKGFSYDPQSDSFIEPKPTQYPSWILDVNGGYWKYPIPKPTTPPSNGMMYEWDESSVSWIQVPKPQPQTN